MTEDEAKKKVCCGPLQMQLGSDPLTHCMGAACMAWRVLEGESHYKTLEDKISRGYCGLAGKP